jgi:hypothetical protein
MSNILPYPYPTSPPSPYGIDFWIGFTPVGARSNAGNSILDADPAMRTVTGRALLLQSLLCRQTMTRGSAIDCPNDGINIPDYVAVGMTPNQIMALYTTIQNELLKDQRVSQATVSGSYSFQSSSLVINEFIQSSYGPFSFTLNVSSVTVTLLNANLV